MIPSEQNRIQNQAAVDGINRILDVRRWPRAKVETRLDVMLMRQPTKDFKWYSYKRLLDHVSESFDLDMWKWGKFDPENREKARGLLIDKMKPEMAESKMFGYEDGDYGYYPDDGVHDGRPYKVDKVSENGVGTSVEDYADAIIALCDCAGFRDSLEEPGMNTLFDRMPLSEKLRLVHTAMQTPDGDADTAMRDWVKKVSQEKVSDKLSMGKNAFVELASDVFVERASSMLHDDELKRLENSGVSASQGTPSDIRSFLTASGRTLVHNDTHILDCQLANTGDNVSLDYLAMCGSVCTDDDLADLFDKFSDDEIKAALKHKDLSKLSPIRMGFGSMYGDSYNPDMNGYLESGDVLKKLLAVGSIWHTAKTESKMPVPLNDLSTVISKVVECDVEGLNEGLDVYKTVASRYEMAIVDRKLVSVPKVHTPKEYSMSGRESVEAPSAGDAGLVHNGTGDSDFGGE